MEDNQEYRLHPIGAELFIQLEWDLKNIFREIQEFMFHKIVEEYLFIAILSEPYFKGRRIFIPVKEFEAEEKIYMEQDHGKMPVQQFRLTRAAAGCRSEIEKKMRANLESRELDEFNLQLQIDVVLIHELLKQDENRCVVRVKPQKAPKHNDKSANEELDETWLEGTNATVSKCAARKAVGKHAGKEHVHRQQVKPEQMIKTRRNKNRPNSSLKQKENANQSSHSKNRMSSPPSNTETLNQDQPESDTDESVTGWTGRFHVLLKTNGQRPNRNDSLRKPKAIDPKAKDANPRNPKEGKGQPKRKRVRRRKGNAEKTKKALNEESPNARKLREQNEAVGDGNTSKPISQREQVPAIETKRIKAQTINRTQPPPRRETPKPRDSQTFHDDEDPPLVFVICSLCRKNGQLCSRNKANPSHCASTNSPHDFERFKTFMLMPSKTIIKQPPGVKGDFYMCNRVQKSGKCTFEKCSFAHSEKELKVWQWMKKHNVNSLAKIAKEVDQENRKIRPSTPGRSVISINATSFPTPVASATYFYQICNRICNSEVELQKHCSSQRYNWNVNTDNEIQWNFRRPPPNVRNGRYELCPKLKSKTCPYIWAKPDCNLCEYAHSEQELDEWKKRWRHRCEKKQIEKNHNLYSYMDSLLEEYQASECSSSILSENVDGIMIECDTSLNHLVENKKQTVTWTFDITVQGDQTLKKVALLRNKDRRYFWLLTDKVKAKRQLLDGATICKDHGSYRVDVQFASDIFGSYQQSVVFDFGFKPCLERKLSVEVGPRHQLEDVKRWRKRLDVTRWTEENMSIVRYRPATEMEAGSDELLRKYSAPRSAAEIINQQTVSFPLTKENYIHKMHRLLELEELQRTQILSSFCDVTDLHITKTIDEPGVFVNAPAGQLFAWLEMPSMLTYDTAAGRLINSSVQTVLLRDEQLSKVIYEAKILNREMVDFDGRKKEKLFICLSESCVTAWRARHGCIRKVQVQFEIDRLPFCKWHFALDQQDSLRIIYPELPKGIALLPDDNEINDREKHLNESQTKVIKDIMSSKQKGNNPILVFGPFGTGKTETLAIAAMLLMKESKASDAHVLICTHSNRAADIYIEKYFDKQLSDASHQILRLYQPGRRRKTTRDTIHKFCTWSSDKSHFIIPSAGQIKPKKIVVVTFMAAYFLVQMKELKGHFTHIFIDEAAQALQCEVLMPLALATPHTCVVFAGDHMQMRQEVYCKEARNQGLNQTIVEHLHEQYRKQGKSEMCHLLKVNYRATEEILEFLSATFYGDPKCLISVQQWQDKPPGVSSLNFFPAHGQEVFDSDRQSWYNEAEVNEIVDRVTTFLQSCPIRDCRPSDICVVASEKAQIDRIRLGLRKVRLRDVEVNGPMEVQGQEFRAIFVSTVRTTKRSAEQIGSLDLGFLTNPNLVNTVLTRTMYYLAVVGNPQTLCTTGRCAPIWSKYIKRCKELGSTSLDKETLLALEDGQNSVSGYHRADDPDEKNSEADKILIQLAEEARGLPREHIEMHDIKHAGGHLDMDYISIRKEDGIAYPVIRKPNAQQRSKRILLSADDWNAEYDSDESDSDFEDMKVNETDCAPRELEALIRSSPDRYKRCRLTIKSATNIRAVVMDEGQSQQPIIISSRRRCGRALDNDEVCVEVKSSDEEDKIFYTAADTAGAGTGGAIRQVDLPQGEVIGIFRRDMRLIHKKLVCTVNENSMGLMTPLNFRFPSMVYVSNRSRIAKQPKDRIPVYSLGKNGDISFDRYEHMMESNGEKKLFKVRILKWERKFKLPLCVVIGVMPQGTTMAKGLDILNIEYSIPRPIKNRPDGAVVNIGKQVERNNKHWLDRRNLTVFTIDPEQSEDLDDGLSIEKLHNGHYRIGIHIADVSAFVEQDSDVDKEARSRGTSFYPEGNEPIHMLPERLSTDLCSLKPGEDKKTLSVFVEINCEAEIVKETIERCIIRTAERLSYVDVELILKGKGHQRNTTEVVDSLQQLHKIACLWRHKRLGDASYFQDLDSDSRETPSAHCLVEEMMMAANEIIARKLLQTFPQCTPLRSQPPPNEEEMDEWKKDFQFIASNTFTLKQLFLEADNVCRCQQECICIKTSSARNKILKVNMPIWHNVSSDLLNAEEAPSSALLNLANPDLLPEATVALGRLYNIRERSIYSCSGDSSVDEHRHDSLRVKAYTHFTSPIRRYMDVVVHRLVIAMLQDQPSPYSKDEMTEICRQCTGANQRAKAYESATVLLAQAFELKEKPRLLHSVVESVSPATLELRFLGSKSFPSFVRRLTVSQLQPCRQPTQQEDSLILCWKEMIYDTHNDQIMKGQRHHKKGDKEMQPFQLNPNRFVAFITTDVWKQLLASVRSQNMQNILKACIEVNKQIDECKESKEVDDVQPEHLSTTNLHQAVEFSLELSPGSVIRIQISSRIKRGLLVPCIQLYSLTPTLDICIEHTSDPVQCFVDPKGHLQVKKTYDSLEDYVNGWSHLVAREAATTSVIDNSSVIIHNVNITWTKQGTEVFGMFQLNEEFCEKRFIEFVTQADRRTNAVDDGTQGEDDEKECSSLDYVCVRYHDLKRAAMTNGNSCDPYKIEDEAVWVGHCFSTETKLDKEGKHFNVTMKLFQCKEPIPDCVNFAKQKATVELIPRSLPLRREDEALQRLKGNDDLLAAVALNGKVPCMSEAHLNRMAPFICMRVPGMRPSNRSQAKAIEKALQSSFSLIQGPPGTGKTVTGVKLAYLLAQYNRSCPSEGNIRPQLLVCGPSNESVDVITEYLSKMGADCPSIVRVYGKTIEQEDFPLPFETKSRKKYATYTRKSSLTKYALHHIIRDTRQCSEAKAIREFDEQIRKMSPGEVLAPSELQHYKKLIFDAKKKVLEKKEVILCTCHTSGSPIIKKGTNIKQLIIDECGMCTEPQSMVPIVETKPEQVILIGDHKQLQPIVTEKKAKRLGLGISLFERHAKKAEMLVTQYRMHEAIASFPSFHFYENKLECGSACQRELSSLTGYWPAGRNKPIVFVHVVGKEESLTVATPEGGVNSKSNSEEAKKVVRVTLDLIWNRNIRQEEILILSQYRAQCSQIKEELNKKYTYVNVSTVVAAQGRESDFVIFSTVRSMPKSQIERKPTESWMARNLGFIADWHQINVALTRAKKGLIIIGNKNLLRSHEMWRSLLDHYEEEKAIVDGRNFPPRHRS